MCINRLVEFELLLELKIEQKSGTSLVKPVLSRRKSGLRTERLSIPVIYFGYRISLSGTPPTYQEDAARVVLTRQLSLNVNEMTVFALKWAYQMVSVPTFLKTLWIIVLKE
jgi:hypothetical protein